MTPKERWDVLTEVIDALSENMSKKHRIRAARKNPLVPPQTIAFQRGTQEGLNEAVRLIAKLRDPTRN